MRARRIWAWAVFCCTLFGLMAVNPLVAQTATTTGGFRGRVTDTEGKPVPSAQVRAINTATGLQRGTTTDGDGRYVLPQLPPGGPYRVQISSIGYRTEAAENIVLPVGAAFPVNAHLQVEAVAIQGIEVTAGRIDVAQGGIGTRVGPEQVQNLPVNGRDFTDFLKTSPLMTPQIVGGTGGSFAINGARTGGNNVQVDGADANNVFFGEARGSLRTPFSFSLESIKEFQLITNGFDVEYGNYQGGVMNAVTRGGTNSREASAFYFHRDQRLTGKDFAGIKPTEYYVHQFGFAAGGPIKRDRVHYFISGDAQLRSTPIYPGTQQGTGIPEGALAQFRQALATRYGVQNPEKYYGTFKQTNNNVVLFGRLDWNLSNNHRITVRQTFQDMANGNDRVNANEAITSGGPYQVNAWTTLGELNSTFGRNAFNTLRVQWSHEERPRPSNPDGGYLPQITVNNAYQTNRLSFGGDGIIFRNNLLENKLQLVDNVVLRSGAHTFKLGTNNILAHTVNTFWLLGNGEFVFNSMADFESGKVARYFRLTRACPEPLVANPRGETVQCPNYDIPKAGFNTLQWSGYAQDDWQVSERLLATLGLRYDGLNFNDKPGRVPAVESAFNLPTGDIPNLSGISPRASLTYDVSGDQRTVLRGGVGVITGRPPSVLVGNVFQTERPLLSVFCTGANIPTIDMPYFLSAPEGEYNPAACRSGGAATGTPEYSVFDPNFKVSQTLKANAGIERLVDAATRVKIDLLFSATRHNYTARDLNLGAERFQLASEAGRPVFVPSASFNPVGGAAQSLRTLNSTFSRVYEVTSDGVGRAYTAQFELSREIARKLNVNLNYAYSRAYDNSTVSCCTGIEIWGVQNQGGAAPVVASAGNPNFLGGVGDDAKGTWGPSSYDLRHVITANTVYHAPWGIVASGIIRLQSGTPWTPTVNGDVNGDGIAGDDRAMVSRNLAFKSSADLDNLNALIGRFSCLSGQVDHIATRNSCRSPGFNSLDLRIGKTFSTVRGQRAEFLLDLFNVLNGLNSDWGQYRTVEGPSQNLLKAESYDAATGKVTYSVNYSSTAGPGVNFGDARPLSLRLYQFQAQIGVRYHF